MYRKILRRRGNSDQADRTSPRLCRKAATSGQTAQKPALRIAYFSAEGGTRCMLFRKGTQEGRRFLRTGAGLRALCLRQITAPARRRGHVPLGNMSRALAQYCCSSIWLCRQLCGTSDPASHDVWIGEISATGWLDLRRTPRPASGRAPALCEIPRKVDPRHFRPVRKID